VAGRVNGVLACDVRVLRLAPAPDGFNARFSAMARRYCYRIADRPQGRQPLDRAAVLWHGRRLDADLMDRAAALLVGEHDFASLSRIRLGASTVRRVVEATVRRTAPGTVEIWVEADAFCHSMVRSIAGALAVVGEGRRDPGWIAELLMRTERDPVAAVLAPHGLTLEAVHYPADVDLAATAQSHRVVRGPLH
jgi:tRNA pseudouridine38-40 synthase